MSKKKPVKESAKQVLEKLKEKPARGAILVRTDQRLLDRLTEVATREGLSANEIAVAAIRRFLDELDGSKDR